MTLFLLLFSAAMILLLIGVAVHGLGFLLILGAVLIAADLVYGFRLLRRRPVR